MIVAAAIRRGRVSALPAFARHHHVIRLMSEQGTPASGTTDQGFVSRERARTIALLEGQVERTDHATQLFSEDLCERSDRRRAGDPDRRAGGERS